jgi:hypothetical protein
VDKGAGPARSVDRRRSGPLRAHGPGMRSRQSATSAITLLGGVSTFGELVAYCGRTSLRRAVSDGSIRRVGRGRYVIATVAEHRQRAHGLTGALSHLSAAVHHGWKVKFVPADAWVTVPRNRHVRGSRDGLHLHWSDLSPAEVAAGVTTPLRTILDCARVLPFDEALAVADSAIRSGRVSKPALLRAAGATRGPGATAIRRVALHADGRADNPLESVLRAHGLDAGLGLTPQLVVAEPGFFAVADLGNEALRLVVEAEGYETHGSRAGLRADCVRHTGYALHGWSSLRFAYEDAMYDREWVLWVFRSWKAGGATTAPPRTAAA